MNTMLYLNKDGTYKVIDKWTKPDTPETKHDKEITVQSMNFEEYCLFVNAFENPVTKYACSLSSDNAQEYAAKAIFDACSVKFQHLHTDTITPNWNYNNALIQVKEKELADVITMRGLKAVDVKFDKAVMSKIIRPLEQHFRINFSNVRVVGNSIIIRATFNPSEVPVISKREMEEMANDEDEYLIDFSADYLFAHINFTMAFGFNNSDTFLSTPLHIRIKKIKYIN